MLTKVEVKFPDDVFATFLFLVDQDGKELCRVDYDDQPGDILHFVAEAICEAAGIPFQGAKGY